MFIQYPFVRASELFVCISKILHGPLMLADRPPRKSVVRLTDRPDMTLDVYRGRKTTIQQYNDRRTFGSVPYIQSNFYGFTSNCWSVPF